MLRSRCIIFLQHTLVYMLTTYKTYSSWLECRSFYWQSQNKQQEVCWWSFLSFAKDPWRWLALLEMTGIVDIASCQIIQPTNHHCWGISASDSDSAQIDLLVPMLQVLVFVKCNMMGITVKHKFYHFHSFINWSSKGTIRNIIKVITDPNPPPKKW